jgi:hypothetical protein
MTVVKGEQDCPQQARTHKAKTPPRTFAEKLTLPAIGRSPLVLLSFIHTKLESQDFLRGIIRSFDWFVSGEKTESRSPAETPPRQTYCTKLKYDCN